MKSNAMAWDKPGVPNIGQPVVLRNLQRRVDLNGSRAFVDAYEPGDKVVLVLAGTNDVVRTNVANVEIASSCMPSEVGSLASSCLDSEGGTTAVVPVGGHCG